MTETYRKLMTALPVALMVLLWCFPAGASAQNWYAGVSIGQSKVDAVECSPEIQALFFDISCNADNKDTAYKFYGGYSVPGAAQSNISAAIEFGYIDFGEVAITGNDSFFGPSRMSFSSSGFNIAGIANIRATDQFILFGKLGLLRWDNDFSNVDQIESFSESESGTDIMFGIGVAFEVSDQASIRAEWERFEIEDEDVVLLSAGIAVRF